MAQKVGTAFFIGLLVTFLTCSAIQIVVGMYSEAPAVFALWAGIWCAAATVLLALCENRDN